MTTMKRQLLGFSLSLGFPPFGLAPEEEQSGQNIGKRYGLLFFSFSICLIYIYIYIYIYTFCDTCAGYSSFDFRTRGIFHNRMTPLSLSLSLSLSFWSAVNIHIAGICYD